MSFFDIFKKEKPKETRPVPFYEVWDEKQLHKYVQQFIDAGWTEDMYEDKMVEAQDAMEKNRVEALLHYNPKYHALSYIEERVKAGADLDVLDEVRMYNPLITAAFNGYDDAVRKMVELGADVNVANGRGETALMHAAAHCSLDTIKFLVKSGANLNAVDHDNKTARVHSLRRSQKVREEKKDKQQTVTFFYDLEKEDSDKKRDERLRTGVHTEKNNIKGTILNKTNRGGR